MKRLLLLLVAALALMVGALAAMPAQDAVAAKPFEDPQRGEPHPSGPPRSDIIPAGLGCSFAVKVEPVVWGFDWSFSDGREVSNNKASQTLTNVETGASYVHRSIYHRTETAAADGGTFFAVFDGSYLADFYPGEQGPEGKVGPDGALYGLIGHFSWTYHVEADVLSFALRGQAIDICQILSG